MSGHSKFANIKHKKEKNDAKKGKIFTVIGREIAVAVKEGGPDPDNNSRLRDVIAKAKANNIPNDTIERGIKKAAGDADSVNYEQITYEGYGPSGVAIIVDTLTDNKNRTASNVRNAFTKGNGNVGTPGCVSYMIEKDVLMTVIEELRKQIPGEIERSHKIILNKDAILEDARVKSQQMIDQAARDAGELIDQNEVVEMAKMRANEIETHAKDTARSVVHNANEEADQIRAGALRYVNEIMEDVQGYLASVKEAQESVFNQLLSALDSDLASIKTNAKEIEEQLS